MENSLLIGLSRVTTLERHLAVISNNLANVNTNGFKSEQMLFEEYLNSTAHEDNFPTADRRISYVQDRGSFHDFAQGAAERTNNPLDVAINGSGFIAVQTAGGERYTRDGNFHLNNLGQLVTASGDTVVGANGPIVFQQTDHDINIAPDGTITVVEGTARVDSIRGKLRVVNFANPQALVKVGNNQFSAANGGAAQVDTRSTVQQGFVEKSNTNSVVEMSRMIEVNRAYANIANMLSQQNDLHKTAIDKLADVPA